MALRPDSANDGADDHVRPHVALWRLILSAPFWLLSQLTFYSGGFLHRCGSLLQSIALGFGRHVYFTLVQAKRWVRGLPTWTERDLIDNSLQPVTKRQIAYARAHAELVEIVCNCGKDDCVLAKRLKHNPHFMHRMQHEFLYGGVGERVRSAVQAGVDKLNRDRRPSGDA